MIHGMMSSIGRAVGRYLSQPVSHYRPLTTSAPSILGQILRPGDILLVGEEGPGDDAGESQDGDPQGRQAHDEPGSLAAKAGKSREGRDSHERKPFESPLTTWTRFT